MTATGWGTLSPAPQSGDSHTDHSVSPPSVGTPGLPNSLGHHAWPHIPSSIPGDQGCSIPCAHHPAQRTLGSGGSPKQAPRGGWGPPLTSSTSPCSLSQPACHPPSWWPCHLEVISPAAAAAVQPWQHPRPACSALTGPRRRPQIAVTHSRPSRRGAGVRARTYPGVQMHSAPTRDRAAGRILPTPRMLLPPSSPGTTPSPSLDCATPCLPLQAPIPVGVLPPSVLALDAACLAGWGKQEILVGRHGGLVTPVVGVAEEAGVPGSSLLPSLGSQNLAPWPDPARRHGASPTLSPCLQQRPPGEESRSRVWGPPHPDRTRHNPNPFPKPLFLC